MSRQDLADEFKETEGNPAVKARIRRLQRQLRRRRMLEEVKRATVVITNPTEFAVALEYGPTMAAPVVLAKGRNLMAQQIKEVARWSGIPLVENPPLAHALYRAVEVGQSIPPKLYAVVAGILAAIYRARRRGPADGTPGRGGKLRPTWRESGSGGGRPTTHSSNGSSRWPRWAWCSSCWCPCPRCCSIFCWPPASPLRCWCCSPRSTFCGRRSFRFSPACCCCLPCSGCR